MEAFRAFLEQPDATKISFLILAFVVFIFFVLLFVLYKEVERHRKAIIKLGEVNNKNVFSSE